MLGTTMRSMVVVIALMVLVVIGLRDYSGLMDVGGTTNVRDTPARPAPARRAPPPRQQASGDGSTMVIAPGEGGHFYVDADINGTGIGMVVDTGATLVTLSRDDAQRIGIEVYQLDYNGRANTANGVARTARVTLDEVTIGDITVRDVPAVVIETPMQISLLGMSFLRRLAGYGVERGRLVLRK